MARQNVPTQPSVRTTQYNNLLGVDYQSDPTEISRRHSPEIVNMISDFGGIPVKRYGYRSILENVINIFEMNGQSYAIQKKNWTASAAHPAIDVSQVDKNSDGTFELTLIKRIFHGSIADVGEPKHCFVSNGLIYILHEKKWVQLDISHLESSYRSGLSTVGDGLYELYEPIGSHGTSRQYELVLNHEDIVPTVQTFLKPNGMEMIALPADTDITGATRGVNLLTPFRRAEYCVQADTVAETKFKLPQPYTKFVSATIKVEILTGAGAWETVAASEYTHATRGGGLCLLPDSTDGSAGWFDYYANEINFTTAPFTATSTGITNAIGTPSSSDVPTTEPNLRITYAPYNSEASDYVSNNYRYPYGYYRKERADAFSSDNAIIYDGRLFVSVGGRVYYSRAGEFFSIDDNYYFEMDNDVIGFTKTPNGLGVICEGSHPIYIASGEYSDTYAMPVYTTKASNANIEQVYSAVGDALNDEPLIISNNGIYGISTNYLSGKYAIQRSGKINKRLCAESSLASAKGLVFNNYLYVAVGTHMYVLDGRHKDASRSGDNSYECYFFDNMPEITDMWAADGVMYFADSSWTYTWNSDLSGRAQYLDKAVQNANGSWSGETVKCKWCSRIDDDDAPQFYKTLQKKGTMVTIAPPMQTSCQITFKKDAHDEVYIGRFDGGTFALSDAVLDAFTKKKIKKYKRLQFVVENNEAEPFGLISIVKSFVANNYAKR